MLNVFIFLKLQVSVTEILSNTDGNYYSFQYSLDFECRESKCDILMSSQGSLHGKNC